MVFSAPPRETSSAHSKTIAVRRGSFDRAPALRVLRRLRMTGSMTIAESARASYFVVTIPPMKRLLILSLLTASSVFAADTHRYIVATTPAARHSGLHALGLAAEAGERKVRTFASIDGFAVDLTDDEAAQMR